MSGEILQLSKTDLRPTWAEIDTDAFAQNIAAIKRLLPERARLAAVLKANAYGHGAVPLARVCERESVAMIAVAILEEALELRAAGVRLPILVFTPSLDERALVAGIDRDITLGLGG